MNNRKKLLLALGIVEWASVSAHLEVMSKSGIDVHPDIALRISAELGALCATWATITGDTTPMACVTTARTYVTENLDYAEQLLAGAVDAPA